MRKTKKAGCFPSCGLKTIPIRRCRLGSWQADGMAWTMWFPSQSQYRWKACRKMQWSSTGNWPGLRRKHFILYSHRKQDSYKSHSVNICSNTDRYNKTQGIGDMGWDSTGNVPVWISAWNKHAAQFCAAYCCQMVWIILCISADIYRRLYIWPCICYYAEI